MGTGERLTYYIENKGFTKRSFCDEFGFEYNSMVMIMADKRTIGMKVLNQLHEVLPKMNVSWLLYEQGPMEITEHNEFYVTEPTVFYGNKSDNFEKLLLNYMDNEKVRNKILQIVKENGK